jgi:hypothetical protein
MVDVPPAGEDELVAADEADADEVGVAVVGVDGFVALFELDEQEAATIATRAGTMAALNLNRRRELAVPGVLLAGIQIPLLRRARPDRPTRSSSPF